MNRLARAVVMLYVGITMARLLWSGSFGFFIQQRMQIPLAIATVILLLLGAYEARTALKEEQDDPRSWRRTSAPRVGWLMVLPLLVLTSVAPTGLGAAAAERVEAFVPVQSDAAYEPLPISDEPIEMRVFDFVDRAVWDPAEGLNDVTVRLEGLVVNDDDIDDGFLLTRFLVSCCAADGVPIQVAIRGLDTTYEDDTWVIADVEIISPDVPLNQLPAAERVVEAEVISIEIEPNPPSDAYESPY